MFIRTTASSSSRLVTATCAVSPTASASAGGRWPAAQARRLGGSAGPQVRGSQDGGQSRGGSRGRQEVGGPQARAGGECATYTVGYSRGMGTHPGPRACGCRPPWPPCAPCARQRRSGRLAAARTCTRTFAKPAGNRARSPRWRHEAKRAGYLARFPRWRHAAGTHTHTALEWRRACSGHGAEAARPWSAPLPIEQRALHECSCCNKH